MEEINKIQNQLKAKRQQNDYEFALVCAKLNFEIWKPIDGYDYLVSNFGNVKNNKTKRILKPQPNSNGYYVVNCFKTRKMISHRVHRLVALAFIPNPEGKNCVDHKDNNIINNKLENLRFATIQENLYNAKLSKNNSTGTKGVTFSKQHKKWHARIMINGKNKHIGYYNTIEEAAEARKQKAKEIHGEFMNACEL